jgi:membrane-associated phospholipid phosphatase
MIAAQRNISTSQRIRYVLIFLLIYFVWSVTYTAIGAWASAGILYTLPTPLDDAIPFVPEFEFIYVLGYLIPFVPIFVVQETSRLNQLIAAFITMNVIAFSIFMFFPVYCPRPKFEVNSVATYLLSLEYATDKPVNNFPSLHAAIAWLLFLGCRRYARWVSGAMLFAAIGICIAALFVKQHYVVDIVAGILLAWGTYALVKHAYLLRWSLGRVRSLIGHFRGGNDYGT